MWVMSMLSIKNLSVKVEEKEVLNDFNLEIDDGSVHVIMGPNGVGKSTLSRVIMGDGNYKVTKGSILFNNVDIKNMPVDERSKLGIFLAMQYPLEIDGVSNQDFLRTAISSHEGKKIGLYEFIKRCEEAADDLKMDKDLIHRSLNVGFSGGEKKKNEVLQLKLLKPSFIILDELDSGLDVDSLKIAATNISKYKKENPNTSILIITHLSKILEYVKMMMNKILIAKNKITSDVVKISGNIITFDKDGEYILEYIESGNYKLELIINAYVKLIEVSFDNELTIDNKYTVNNDLKVIKFYNNKKVVENIDIDLLKEGANIDYHFANICKEKERYTINVNHKCKKTSSNIINRSIAFKNSILKFIINSNVKKEAIESELDQNTRIVTMGECDAAISPNMFIPMDNVIAKHGSVIGSFKDDQVFYLMSKGINYNDTLKLLIKGYIFGNLDIDFENRKKIMDIIDMYWR